MSRCVSATGWAVSITPRRGAHALSLSTWNMKINSKEHLSSTMCTDYELTLHANEFLEHHSNISRQQ